MNITLTDAMFNLEYIAASLGVDIQSGGLSVDEVSLATSAIGGSVTLPHTPVAFDGTLIGWYKLPTEENWTVGTITGDTMIIPGSAANTTYCVKYFYQNANARQIIIKTQYVPSELHVTILNDLWAGDIANTSSDTTKIGKLITDVPRLQMDGNQSLSLTSSGAATTSLSGSALAVSSTDSCEEDPFYGTMTEELTGVNWQDTVVAIAPADGDIELEAGGTQTLQMYAVFGGMTASALKPNTVFSFTVDSGDSYVSVDQTGEVTAIAAGTAYVSVTLTGYASVPAAMVKVTVQ